MTYSVIDADASGTFSGSLANQGAGQKTLNLRWGSHVRSFQHVGIGDNFGIAGQSNATGQGTSNQTWSHATLYPGLFGHDYNWKELADPTGDSENQVDTVATNGSFGGSAWPLMATSYMASLSRPCGFVVCSKGGSTIAQWQPGADHLDRTTLYGSMNYRCQLVGGVKCILMYHGETDALNAISQEDYSTGATAFVDAVWADLGVPVLYGLLHTISGRDVTNVNAAITALIAANSHCYLGADMTGVEPDGDLHFTSNADLSGFAAAWWSSLQAAFGWS